MKLKIFKGFHDKMKQIKIEKKQLVISDITREWSDSEVKVYCCNHSIDGTNNGFNYLSSSSIQHHILGENAHLFTRDEFRYYSNLIEKNKVLRKVK